MPNDAGFFTDFARPGMDRNLILNPAAPLSSARQLIQRQHMHDATRTLHHQNAGFYQWEGTRYVEHAPEEMRAAIWSFLGTAMRVADDNKLAPFEPNKNRVANVMEALAAETQLSGSIRPPAFLGSGNTTDPADLIACANGLLHLPTMELLPHAPDFFNLNVLDFPYRPNAPKPAGWLAFLGSVWPNDQEAIDTLQELFGLCLTADTSFQKMFLIVGPKRSGKGTIARILTLLLGAANVCGPTLSGMATNFGLAPLIGKRLAIISDARLGRQADPQAIAERLLAISGEDSLTVDRKNRESWTGKLDTRFLILTNELPRLTDSSGALAGRFIILPMRESFYGREDRGLQARIAADMPGIFLWAIEGHKRLVVRGHFKPPASSEAAVRQLDDLGSPIGAFLRECCIIEAGRSVKVTDLYGAWCDWCHENGRDHAGTKQGFGKDMSAAIPGLTVTQPRTDEGRARYYEGLGFDPEALAEVVARAGTRASASWR